MKTTSLKNLKPAALFLLFAITGCARKEAYVMTSPPFHPYVPEHTKLAYFSPPPVMMPPVKVIDEIQVSSPQFRIVVPIVLDKTGKTEGIKNLMDVQFSTALGATNRFSVMGTDFALNIVRQQYDNNTFVNSSGTVTRKRTTEGKTSGTGSLIAPHPATGDTSSALVFADSSLSTVSSSITATDTKENIVTDYYGLYETHPELYEALLDTIGQYSDGVLKINISGNDAVHNKVDIDYWINLTNTSLSKKTTLFQGHGQIGYTMESGTTSKTLNREDIIKIANEIKEKFPSNDVQNFHITELQGNNKITVNAGKDDNIKPGMIGYVIKNKGTRIAYRAMFEVTEVQDKSFIAEMKVEDKASLPRSVTDQDLEQYRRILNSIKENEPVRMK